MSVVCVQQRGPKEEWGDDIKAVLREQVRQSACEPSGGGMLRRIPLGLQQFHSRTSRLLVHLVNLRQIEEKRRRKLAEQEHERELERCRRPNNQ